MASETKVMHCYLIAVTGEQGEAFDLLLLSNAN
jgi:hypothetical protein